MSYRIFNIAITGVGGQGIITLSKLIGRSALLEGFDVRVAEIHGMAQRGGSILTHIRFGKEVYSSLIPKFSADILLGLEAIEVARYIDYLAPGGYLLLSDHIIRPPMAEVRITVPEIVASIRAAFHDNVNTYVIDAYRKALELGNAALENTIMLGALCALNIVSITKESFIKAIKDVIPPRYLEINLTAFEEGYKSVHGKTR
ncbi:MAG: indolepyruvate oxidoreductase subunit beta [Thermoprotei archaeon]|nr:MAG: indolepyruvate oxidoreductase subunit beta [Thermoprotei archaeon]